VRSYTLENRHGGEPSRIDFAAELNEQQLAAVTSPAGPALVIAGAGSGKTRTLIYRVAYLLDNGVDAKNILLLTFTNKAAREMLQRVEHLLPLDISSLWGGTFHSVANRILRRHADKLGYQRNFTIMDREDQKDLLASVITESELDPKAMRFPKPEVLADIFSLMVNTGTGLRELLSWRYPYFEKMEAPIATIRRAYEEKKKSSNSMDFDDLLTQTLSLFRGHPDVLEHYRYQFQFVLVDEYQDTNTLQAEFIDSIAGQHRNLMVVGDDAQSIYSWRGANFRNILKFPERYPGAKIYKIEMNYRSVPEILSLANRAIAANREQFEKNLQPARTGRKVLPALVPLQSPTEQAQFVAQRILELRDEGVELEEMAVLYRAHFHSMEIQMELTNRGIPFQITSGLRFFEQAHIKDVAAFMKIAVNRRDEVAFKRMVKLLPGIGGKTAETLWHAWLEGPGSAETLDRFSGSMLEFKIPAKARPAWEQLAYTLDELLPEGKPAAPTNMIRSIMGGVYEEYLRSKFPNAESRRQDIEQLEQYGEQFREIDEFLAQLSLMTGVDMDETPGVEKDSEAVCLTSVHQAKGLEWRVAFVVWLADGMFPNARVLDSDPTGEGLEEERRLFYVAITRAKDELYLTYPRFWQTHDGRAIQKKSRFLDDFPPELVEPWNVGSRPF
jgi:DNA helicase II / ATP-dependent DNA helicase PcrA